MEPKTTKDKPCYKDLIKKHSIDFYIDNDSPINSSFSDILKNDYDVSSIDELTEKQCFQLSNLYLGITLAQFSSVDVKYNKASIINAVRYLLNQYKINQNVDNKYFDLVEKTIDNYNHLIYKDLYDEIKLQGKDKCFHFLCNVLSLVGYIHSLKSYNFYINTILGNLIINTAFNVDEKVCKKQYNQINSDVYDILYEG